MHVSEIYRADVGNGTGMRVSLFVSGCTIHCKGCFNEKTWDLNPQGKWVCTRSGDTGVSRSAKPMSAGAAKPIPLPAPIDKP